MEATPSADTLSVDLEDGRTIVVPIGWYPRLAYGTPAERANFHVSGAGHGIHWPDLDEERTLRAKSAADGLRRNRFACNG